MKKMFRKSSSCSIPGTWEKLLAVGDLAYEGARRIIEVHERMILRGADREAFLRAAARPEPPTKRLIAAMRRHKQLNK